MHCTPDRVFDAAEDIDGLVVVRQPGPCHTREAQQQPQQDAPRHVSTGVVGFLGGERELFDSKVEPDGEGQGGEYTADAVGEPARGSGIGGNVQCELFEIDVGEGAHPEHGED